MMQDNDQQVAQALEHIRSQPSKQHDQEILGRADELLNSRPRATRKQWRLPLALAASLAVATVLSVQFFSAEQDAVSITRGASDGVLPANESLLVEAPTTLQWPKIASARGYRVVVRDASAEIVWTGEPQQAASLSAPGELREAIALPGKYIWSVEVLGDRKNRQLGPFFFRVSATQ